MDRGDLIDGRYRLAEHLGHGGMSVVWRADDETLGREVAVKVLSPALADDPTTRERIRSEARAAAGLRHPGIVAVFDYGELTEAGHVLSYVVMELVEGRSLADMMTGGPLPWRLAVLISAEVAGALAAAHRAGIVHRDVKPGNVMVAASGVKLVDFGISATVGELDGVDGMVLGTPAYLAPERVAGGPVRPATDVYALGLLLYRALSGRMPWTATTVTQMIKAQVYAVPAPLPPVPGLPPEVLRLLRRCLAKKPGERPSSGEIAHVLAEISGAPNPTRSRTTAEPASTMSSFALLRSRSRSRSRRSRAPQPTSHDRQPTVPSLHQDSRAQKPTSSALQSAPHDRHTSSSNWQPDSRNRKPTSRQRRPRRAMIGAAAAVSLFAVTATWWTLSGTSPEPTAAAAATPTCTACQSPAAQSSETPTSTSKPAVTSKTSVTRVVDQRVEPAKPQTPKAKPDPALKSKPEVPKPKVPRPPQPRKPRHHPH